MIRILLWMLFAYLVGSVPFAYLIGKSLAHADIRQIGDGNPGGTNAWKAGGWQIGLLAVALEIFKGFFPVYLAQQSGLSGWGLLVVCLAPILGHATQPFLGWRGGKALGVSGGVWLALIGWMVFPLYASFTLPVLVLQMEHAYAALAGMFALIAFAFLHNDDWLLTFAVLNTTLLFWTHRHELGRPLRWRTWVTHFLSRGQA